jgi:hypothetical protein
MLHTNGFSDTRPAYNFQHSVAYLFVDYTMFFEEQFLVLMKLDK